MCMHTDTTQNYSIDTHGIVRAYIYYIEEFVGMAMTENLQLMVEC